MKSLAHWLKDYGNDHRNKTNQVLHRVCVPLILFSIVGLLHLIPVPASIIALPGLGLGDVMIIAALLWYILLGVVPFVLMLAQIGVFIAITQGLLHIIHHGLPWVLLAVFVLGWIGQFYGHKVEGRRPSFFTDLQYLLIGPLWIWLGRHHGDSKHAKHES